MVKLIIDFDFKYLLLWGIYVWDESGEVAEYINWGLGQPTTSTNYDCVLRYYDEDNYYDGWHVNSCSLDYLGDFHTHALCEL